MTATKKDRDIRQSDALLNRVQWHDGRQLLFEGAAMAVSAPAFVIIVAC